MIFLSLILFLVTLITAAISGAIGMAGGVLLLSFMTFVMPVRDIIPIHGLIQMQNNGLRVFYLRRYIKKDYFFYFVLGATPGILIAALFLKSVSATTIPLILVFILILYSVFKPKNMPGIILSAGLFSFVGLISGFLGILIGATGPFLANFFIREDFSKEEIVANKSAMQAYIHLAKLPVFFYLGFDYSLYLLPLVFMAIAGVIGTKFGVGVISKINKNLFIKLYKGAMLIAGFRILYKLIF